MDSRKQVHWKEAFDCFLMGGTILVELNGWERKYNGFTQWALRNISWSSINHGKWYILSE